MLKKIIAILCAACLVLMVSGCGDEEKSEKNSQKTSQKTSEKESTPTPAPSQPDTSSEDDKKEPEGNTMKNNPELWKTKMVALTFDDGPQECNGELLDILKAKGVKATFFLQGNNMEKYPDLVKRMIEEGHDVGWHSYEHKINSQTRLETVQKDFAKAQAILSSLGLDYKMKYLRCPGGNLSDNITLAATEQGWRIINWTNYGFDDHVESTATIEERAAKTFEKTPSRNGDVCLIHPRNSDIAKAVGVLIDNLQAEGVKVVCMSELLQRKNGGNAGELYAHGYTIY